MRLWPFNRGTRRALHRAGLEAIEIPVWMLSLVESGAVQGYSDELATRLYERTAVVHGCVAIIARAVSTLPVMLVEGDETWTFDDPPPEGTEAGRILRLLRRPNPDQSLAEFLDMAAVHYHVYGRLFMEADISTAEGSTRIPTQLNLHAPSVVKVETSPDRKRLLKFSVARGDAPLVDRTLYHHTTHPEQRHGYVSPIAPLVQDMVSLDEIAKWRLRLIRNGVRGLFISLEDSLTDEQRQQLLEEMEEKWQGPENAGKIKLLMGKASVNEVGVSPTDVDWLEGYRLSRTAVCSTLGVPPEMMGDDQSKTFANWKEARKSLYTETVLPFAEGLFDEMNAKWFSQAGVSLQVARHEIEVLRDSPVDETNRLANAWWMTINERRGEMGLPTLDDPLADVPLIPSNLLPLSDTGDVATPAAAGNGVPYPS